MHDVHCRTPVNQFIHDERYNIMNNQGEKTNGGYNKKHRYNNKKHYNNKNKRPAKQNSEADVMDELDELCIDENEVSIEKSERKAPNPKQNNKNFKKQKPYQKKEEAEETISVADESIEEINEINDEIITEVLENAKSENDDTATEIKYHDVAGVRFKQNGKVYYFDKNGLELQDGGHVIVDTARGAEYGEVAFSSKSVPEYALVLPLRCVIRLANKEDTLHHKENKEKEKEAFDICLEKIAKHELDMKLVEVQYTFDNSKLLFYFTSSGRVDFRELVKDLASVFKTRIELRQIGIRDEAKLLGGLGACGRPLCCATFLSDFAQVSIKMAKEQGLSLNTGKISGCCGRLMCCLQYEYSTYAEESAKTPPVDSVVKTPDGIGTVTEISPLCGNVKVRLKDNPDVMPKVYHRDDVKLISRPQNTNEE